jgi:hypothetical protein
MCFLYLSKYSLCLSNPWLVQRLQAFNSIDNVDDLAQVHALGVTVRPAPATIFSLKKLSRDNATWFQFTLFIS